MHGTGLDEVKGCPELELPPMNPLKSRMEP